MYHPATFSPVAFRDYMPVRNTATFTGSARSCTNLQFTDVPTIWTLNLPAKATVNWIVPTQFTVPRAGYLRIPILRPGSSDVTVTYADHLTRIFSAGSPCRRMNVPGSDTLRLAAAV